MWEPDPDSGYQDDHDGEEGKNMPTFKHEFYQLDVSGKMPVPCSKEERDEWMNNNRHKTVVAEDRFGNCFIATAFIGVSDDDPNPEMRVKPFQTTVYFGILPVFMIPSFNIWTDEWSEAEAVHKMVAREVWLRKRFWGRAWVALRNMFRKDKPKRWELML